MKIQTVQINEKKAENWLVNKGHKDEFIAPMNYTELAEEMDENNPLKATYEALDKWFMDGNKPLPYIQTDEETSEELLKRLMMLCDTKQIEAQKLILGEKATPLQLQRYDDKYARAKAGEFEDAVNQAIIAKYEQARSAIRNFVDLIELFRGAVDDLIKAQEFDKAKRLIEAGRGLDASTTTEQIQQLLGGV